MGSHIHMNRPNGYHFSVNKVVTLKVVLLHTASSSYHVTYQLIEKLHTNLHRDLSVYNEADKCFAIFY